ncbi:MAG TPA: beta-ketoacyl synthase N-terminal-like domain-containing protein [Labilithrix sp.]|nr:beta-ketoacyl synthase N-terminal-like domain-containing protein [Labilithrix sp.]
MARGVCSPFGEGAAAFGTLSVGELPETRVARDDELVRAGLERPYVARAPLAIRDGVDRATALLEHTFVSCARELDKALPGWRDTRVGAAIGTSSGGMRSFEDLLDAPGSVTSERALAATYIGPLVGAARPIAFEPVSLVLGACASSTLAIGLGRAWLMQDRCDVVLCGGFDAVSVFVAAGFESLRATCGPLGPRPFREGRDGLALGEGAAVIALVRHPETLRAPRVYGWIAGFGASCDAAHLTAPDGRGAGLARAAIAAIEEAGRPAIGLVSAHGTATRQNDSAEAAAIVEALGRTAKEVPVYSLKGAIGHTLGAAGALEVVSATVALEAGVAPASVGEGATEAGLRVLDRAEPCTARAALKLSSAFGGANAALVVSVDRPNVAIAPRPHAYVSSAVSVGVSETDVARLAQRTGYGADRIARADLLVRLAMAATAALEDANGGPGALRGAGILVGHGLATVETNAQFQARIRAAGATRAEPRRFAYTTPNAGAGECAVAFGLTGPAFAVGGGPHGGIEAIGVAADLVRARVADRIVVVAVDEVGEATARIVPDASSDKMTSGAVALLVTESPGAGAGRLESCSVRFEAGARLASVLPSFSAHRALLPLTMASGRPERISVDLPWGGFANATFFWL